MNSINRKNKTVVQCIASLGGGGAERQVVILCNELAKLGWTVHLVVLEYGQNLASLDREHVTLHRLIVSSNYDLSMVSRIRKIILDVNADVVQTWLPLMDIAGGIAALTTRRPWILTERTSQSAYSKSNARIFVRRILGRFANAIVANSSGGIAYWNVVPRLVERCKVIPNAIPFDKIEEAPPEDDGLFRRSDDCKLILYVGRLIPSKNLHNLLTAFSRVLEQDNSVLILCGEGPEKPALESLAKDLKIFERVRFLGYVSNAYGWMKSADVLVMPSRYEGMPNSLIEAAAVGCRICLSDIDAHREILGPKSGYFFDCDDVIGMSAALHAALQDTTHNVSIVDNAKKDVAMLSAPEVGKRYEELLSKVST
ncbi:glycosyltransferase [Zoogloea sp. 1C4]|uniref:glycosyltransferase n=1 Tax=Zoogloea sp. 1C4 TaxID=2570190 RepID=UPI001291E1FC|nr:glycosyltransferase [Zoogloea sp. 1C4]